MTYEAFWQEGKCSARSGARRKASKRRTRTDAEEAEEEKSLKLKLNKRAMLPAQDRKSNRFVSGGG